MKSDFFSAPLKPAESAFLPEFFAARAGAVAVVCEVLAVQPHAQRVPVNIRDVIQLFSSVFRLRGAHNAPVNVEVVIAHPRWTKRRLRNPVRMTAYSRVIRENGDVTVHVLHRRYSLASFKFNTQHVEVKPRSFLRLVNIRAKLQVLHTYFTQRNRSQLMFRMKSLVGCSRHLEQFTNCETYSVSLRKSRAVEAKNGKGEAVVLSSFVTM